MYSVSGGKNMKTRRFPLQAVVTVGLYLAGAGIEAVASAPPPVAQDQDLTRKLIRQTTVGRTAEETDLMTRIIQAMEQCAYRLGIEFDASDRTRAVQEQIIRDIDEAIQVAANATQRKSSSTSQSSDKRSANRPQPKPGKSDRPSGAMDPAQTADQPADQPTRTANDADGALPPGELKDRRRSWGNLPMRDRDEVIEGMDDAIMPRFREWIERYYRALQSSGKEEKE